MGCIPCKAPRSKATSHHTNVPASLVPGECSHCGNDQTLYLCSQECSSTSQPRPNSSSDLRPAIIHSSKTDPVEVARHIWRRQTGGDVRGVAYSRHTHQKSTPSHSGCLVHTPTACQYSTTNTADGEHPGSFEDWCSQREQSYPQFQYWTTVLVLELSTLIYVRSLREANFSMVSFRLGFYSGLCTIVKSQQTLGMVLGLQSHHITHAEPGQEFIVPNLRCTLPPGRLLLHVGSLCQTLHRKSRRRRW